MTYKDYSSMGGDASTPGIHEDQMKQYETIYEDADILVVNKLGAMPVQKDKSGDTALQDLIKEERADCAAFLEAAHRIDRRTSGILVFARNHAALAALDEAFRERRIAKTYIACVEREPQPESGVLIHAIVTDTKRNISIALDLSKVGSRKVAKAELAYALVSKTDRYFFVKAEPVTGRHHQIRAQFAAMGWPIKGDLKYGARRSSASGRIMLHSWKLSLPHPRTGVLLELTATPPDDETLWKVFAAI